MTKSQDGPIELVLPGHSRSLRLARLVASGVVGTYGLSVENVEDVRIAVDEICAALIESGRGEPLHLTFAPNDEALVIVGRTRRDDGAGTNDRRLVISRRILDVLADDHQFDHINGHAVFTVAVPFRH